MLNISRLLPSEEKFFTLLQELTEQAGMSATLLKSYINAADDGAREKASKAIHASRSVAKRAAADITRELCLTFVTPFDREDIQDLSSTLYKIPKTIEKVIEFIELHPLPSISETMKQTDLILQEAEVMHALIKALVTGAKLKIVMEKADLLDKLEDEGDKMLRILLSDLVKNTSDARELILKKDIYDMLEKVIDRYRDGAAIALKIVLKHN